MHTSHHSPPIEKPRGCVRCEGGRVAIYGRNGFVVDVVDCECRRASRVVRDPLRGVQYRAADSRDSEITRPDSEV